ncbi:MAG: hypothetical protein BWY59_02535 [Verrucomicrobia bacterium ADurb.Bin345]|nr:MAG: hypothetical protein BWY59_02535 [Verrucomicrobia bacterium ADurb.Bin345]
MKFSTEKAAVRTNNGHFSAISGRHSLHAPRVNGARALFKGQKSSSSMASGNVMRITLDISPISISTATSQRRTGRGFSA